MTNFFSWFYDEICNSYKIRLSIFIDNKFSFYFLNNTFIIFFNKLNELLYNREKPFIKESIKEFIALNIFSFCDF